MMFSTANETSPKHINAVAMLFTRSDKYIDGSRPIADPIVPHAIKPIGPSTHDAFKPGK
jgi:hypothetical protein